MHEEQDVEIQRQAVRTFLQQLGISHAPGTPRVYAARSVCFSTPEVRKAAKRAGFLPSTLAEIMFGHRSVTLRKLAELAEEILGDRRFALCLKLEIVEEETARSGGDVRDGSLQINGKE